MLLQAWKREKLYWERTWLSDVFEIKQVWHKVIDFFDFLHYPALSVYNHTPYVVSWNRKYQFVMIPWLIQDKTNNRWYQRYYRSEDGWKTWSTTDLVNTTSYTGEYYKIWCCSNDGKYVFYSYYTYWTYNTSNRLYISNNYGASYWQSATISFWQILHVNCSGDWKYVYVLIQTWASTFEIRRSDDYGSTFSVVNLWADVLSLSENSKIAMSADGSIVYTTCQTSWAIATAVKKSTNFGVTWSNIATSTSSFIQFTNVVCSANGNQYAYITVNTSSTPNVLATTPYGGWGYATNSLQLLWIDNYWNVYNIINMRPFTWTAGWSYYELVVFKSGSINTRLNTIIQSTEYAWWQRMTGSDEIMYYKIKNYSYSQVVAAIPELYSVNRVWAN